MEANYGDSTVCLKIYAQERIVTVFYQIEKLNFNSSLFFIGLFYI
jgi:hypothetical protein